VAIPVKLAFRFDVVIPFLLHFHNARRVPEAYNLYLLITRTDSKAFLLTVHFTIFESEVMTLMRDSRINQSAHVHTSSR
jgi:hypothetical protein